MKKCKTCNKSKPIESFSFRRDSNSYRNNCKECRNDIEKDRHKTKNGLINTIYNNQKRACKKRGHEKPFYTKNELKDWIINHKDFDSLYNNWVDSNYNKKMTPSVDRLDDSKTYSFCNIRLITWNENDSKSRNMQLNGTLKTTHKAVAQYDLEMNYINEYNSQKEAERKTGIHHSCISDVCRGKYKQSGGYIWKYKL